MPRTTQDTSSSSSLPVKHVSVTSERFLKTVEGRRKGTVKSLRTGFPKLDKALLDGIE